MKNKGYAKFGGGGGNKVHYGRCASSEIVEFIPWKEWNMKMMWTAEIQIFEWRYDGRSHVIAIWMTTDKPEKKFPKR